MKSIAVFNKNLKICTYILFTIYRVVNATVRKQQLENIQNLALTFQDGKESVSGRFCLLIMSNILYL